MTETSAGNHRGRTETAPEASPVTEPFVFERPIQTVGRRKEAVVRVRLVPGTGKFQLNGRSLEDYFPNKVHQQLIKAPLVTVDRVDNFDIYAHLARRRSVRAGRRAASGHRPRADRGLARRSARR